MKKKTTNNVYVISGISIAVLLLFILFVLFLNGNNKQLPFTFTANSVVRSHYNFQIHNSSFDNTDFDDTSLGIYDMENLTFSNSVSNEICWPNCNPWGEDLRRNALHIKVEGAVFRVYKVKGPSIVESHSNDKKNFALIYYEENQKDPQRKDFDSLSSLEGALQNNLVYSFMSPSNFEVLTSEGKDKEYKIKLFSDYLEIFQDKILSNCDILHVFNEKAQMKTRSIYVNETCKNSNSKDTTQFEIFFSTDAKTVISVKNAWYVLPENKTLEGQNDNDYLIFMDGDVDSFIIENPDNEVNFYTEGFNDELGPWPDGYTEVERGDVLIKDLPGNVILGKSEYKIPPFSELNFKNVEKLHTDFNLINVRNAEDYFPIQAQGNSRDALLNRDSLSLDEKMEIENFKSLLIPVLTAILTTILGFSLGIFYSNREAKKEKSTKD